VPIYPETRGTSSRLIRYILRPALLAIKNKIPETLPEKIIKEANLLSFRDALEKIHFPTSLKEAEKPGKGFDL